jgi:hypothetical protein
MADFNYQKTLEDIGNKLVDLTSDIIKVALCTAAYTAVQATDHTLADIPSSAIVATATLSGKSFTGAVFDADDVTFAAPPSGHTVTQAVIYQSDGASPEGTLLIRKISGDSYAGFPFVTSGSDIPLIWPNDANKIFSFVNA